jgi:hypothetical protein
MRTIRRWLAVVAVILLVMSLMASAGRARAQPALDDQCSSPSYAKLHPTICGPAASSPFGIGGSPGGAGSSGGGGVLGTIGKIVGGLL